MSQDGKKEGRRRRTFIGAKKILQCTKSKLSLIRFNILSEVNLSQPTMPNEECLNRVCERNKNMQDLVDYLKKEVSHLRGILVNNYITAEASRIKAENKQLKEELETWKSKLVEIEVQNGIKQISLPSGSVLIKSTEEAEKPPQAPSKVCTEDLKQDKPNEVEKSNEEKPKKEVNKKEKPAKTGKAASETPKVEEKEINVSRLDMRVGRILSVSKHPDADSLYVEQIDVGEEKPRTVVSGLVKFVPQDQMQDRLVIVLCNLKPAKMRGITSEAMVMCASTPEKVEILDPPEGSVPGDQAVCDDYPGEPDALLNPKKKIFEQVAPDLKTNDSCVATYKASPLKVLNKGIIKSASLSNVNIK